MYNNNMTDIQQGITQCVDGYYASIDFNMEDLDDSDDLTKPNQEADMEVESEELKQSLLPLRTFMDVDAEMTGTSEIKTLSLAKHHYTGKDLQNVRPVKVRGSYRRYTAFQTEKLFELVIEEGKTAKDAALMIGINIRTAQHYIKKYHDDEEKCLPVGGSKKFSAGRTNKLAEEHSKFLVEYIDERPAAVLSKIRHHLCEAFPGLTISISALQTIGAKVQGNIEKAREVARSKKF